MTKLLQTYRSIMAATALALLVVVGSPTVATAMPGSDKPGAGQARSQVAVTDEPVSTTQTAEEAAPETEKRSQARTKAEAKVKALREERKVTTTTDKREKVCDSRKKGLETRINSLSTNAQRYQDRVDAVFEKLPASAKVDAATEFKLAVLAQAKSKDSVEALALAKQNTVIDCKDVNVATEIAAYKTIAQTAREDLKAYKMAVKDILKTLKTKTATTPEATSETTEAVQPPKTETTEGAN